MIEDFAISSLNLDFLSCHFVILCDGPIKISEDIKIFNFVGNLGLILVMVIQIELLNDLDSNFVEGGFDKPELV